MSKKLSEKAMLVGLRISQWTGRSKDSSITDEVISAKQAETDSGEWHTYLLPKRNRQELNSAYSNCRAVFLKHTLPWMDDGMRILPSAMFIEYSKHIREAINKYNVVVEDFIKEYSLIVSDAQNRLGKLLDTKKLPSVYDIKDKFGIKHFTLPIPNSEDFRAEMGEENSQEVRQQITTTINEMTNKAMKSIWDKLSQLIEKIETAMNSSEATFRNSVITNLKEFCELIPKLNIMDDNKLESIRQSCIATLTNLDPGDLRLSQRQRDIASSEAHKLLETLKNYA